MKKTIITFLTAISLLLPKVALANLPGVPGPGAVPACKDFSTCLDAVRGPSSLSYIDLPAKIINIFLPVILGIGGFITVILIIISGIQFITSSGNPEAAGAARGRLIYALIGFAVIVLAFAALQIINTIFLGNTGLV